jgi:hypothetical protein
MKMTKERGISRTSTTHGIWTEVMITMAKLILREKEIQIDQMKKDREKTNT